MQLQTILDDDYVPLEQYFEKIKKVDLMGWQQYVAKIGGEENALLYDSKAYFNNSSIAKKERGLNYARNLFAFLSVFNPDLECIGVTDHNYFDDCLLDTLIDYSRKSQSKMIPGFEINCQGIHMLLFFADKLYKKETFSAGIHTFLAKFNIHNRKTSSALTTTSADIKDIIDEVMKNNGIIIYPHCNSSNGLFQERTSTDRTHFADIFNHQRTNLLQSQNYESCLEISKYIKSNHRLTSQFCLHISSDARSIRDIGKCDPKGNYLWIKADPTFEGLKQIVFEPQQRIFIGPQKPEEKKSYFVIDRVRFLDNTGDANFAADPIEMNQNLTTIIGGKSTGKSLLLYYMAKTIDREEVENRIAGSGLTITYDFDAFGEFNFEVTWKDGQQTFLSNSESVTEGDSKKRKILYIPQRYLNTLSEENIKSKAALNEFVLNIILQDLDIKDKYEQTLTEIRLVGKTILTEISQLFSDKDEIKRVEEELKQAGDEKGIKSYIQTLQKQIDALKARSGLNSEELKDYEVLTAREKEINVQVSNLHEDKKTINNFQMSLTSHIEDILSTTDEYEQYLNDIEIKDKFKIEFKVIDSIAMTVQTAASNVISAIDTKIESYSIELTQIKAELSPLLAKVQLQSELQEKTDELTKEQQKLNEISIKKKNLKAKKALFEKRASNIIDAYKQIVAKYENLRNELKKFESKFGDISLSILVGFKEDLFNSMVVNEYLNKNDLKRVIPEAEWGEEFVYRYDSQKHLQNISIVFKGLVVGNINTVRGRQAKDAASKLLENYFYLDFRIFYKNDSFDKMSPGKKGLVLLQLLINLSNEEWPILLDQPDDDLDSRTVYDDLVEFLKKKKVQRQIIIITHNPNLVVGADAEEVIVANQSGQEIGRENKRYRFEYVSGAIENTFELDEK